MANILEPKEKRLGFATTRKVLRTLLRIPSTKVLALLSVCVEAPCAPP